MKTAIRYASTEPASRNERGQVQIAGTNQWGEAVTTVRNLRVRGRDTDGQGRVFSLAGSGTGASRTYNATTGMYEFTSGTAEGGYGLILHNDVLQYVETHPSGFILTSRVSSGSALPTRVEWGMYSRYSTTATDLRTTDGYGFYYENGVLGVWVRNTLLAGTYPENTVDVPQADWDDPLDGSGPSGRQFAVADLVNITIFSASEVWLGVHGVEWVLNGVAVHARGFRWGEDRMPVPNGRYPDRRPGVYQYNTGASSAVTVYVNCLSGFRDTEEFPKTQEVAAERATARTSLANGVEVPFAAFRVALTHHWRQLYPEHVEVRATGQNVRVKVRVGRPADFGLTADNWVAVPENHGSGVEESLTDMGWTNAGTGQLATAGVIYPAADETMRLDLESFFRANWIGVDGDGVQRILLLTATPLAGNNASIELTRLRGRVFG